MLRPAVFPIAGRQNGAGFVLWQRNYNRVPLALVDDEPDDTIVADTLEIRAIENRILLIVDLEMQARAGTIPRDLTAQQFGTALHMIFKEAIGAANIPGVKPEQSLSEERR